MCTAIVFGEGNRYFGRNLDYEVSFGESVVVVSRNFNLKFRYLPDLKDHYAFVGMAHVKDGYPLLYEATNEKGLSIAGLNFVGNCQFARCALDTRVNLCQFELIPYIMAKCASVREACSVFDRINLLGEAFTPDLPVAQLHWMLSDEKECCVLEITRSGVNAFCNNWGVLTNNPPFPYHEYNLDLYRGLSNGDLSEGFGDGMPHDRFSRGMGAFGLPGDWSSTSRFVRAAFVRACAMRAREGETEKGVESGGTVGENGVAGEKSAGKTCAAGENSASRNGAAERIGGVAERIDDVVQFFHILSSVAMVKGCVAVGNDFEYTQYSSCCDARRGVYYFKTYGETCIRRVDMYDFALQSGELICLDLDDCQRV